MNGPLNVTSSGENQGKARRLGSPGIVVLSSSLRLLHMNQRACELSKRLQDTDIRSEHDLPLPSAWKDLADEIGTQLRIRTESHKEGQFQITRQISRGDDDVLLKGFGLLSQKGFGYSRIVIVLS